MKKKVPSTSKDAHKRVSSEMLTGHYKKIIGALQALGTANACTIGKYCGLDMIQVSRRLSELEKLEADGGLELVYKPGTVSLTSSKRKAFNYCLTGKGMPTVEPKPEKPAKRKPVTAKQLSFKEIFGE